MFIPIKKLAVVCGIIFIGIVIFASLRSNKVSSRAEGDRLMETTRAEPVSTASPVKAEDRPATPAETLRVLALRKEIVDLRQQYEKSKLFYDAYMSELDWLRASLWSNQLFEKWQAGTLKDKELPRIVRSYDASRTNFIDGLESVITSLAKQGLQFAVLPDQERVNWDLMTDQVRYLDLQRYELVAESLRRSVRQVQSVTASDKERLQVIAVLDRLNVELANSTGRFSMPGYFGGPPYALNKMQCSSCQKLAYYRTDGAFCIFCLKRIS